MTARSPCSLSSRVSDGNGIRKVPASFLVKSPRPEAGYSVDAVELFFPASSCLRASPSGPRFRAVVLLFRFRDDAGPEVSTPSLLFPPASDRARACSSSSGHRRCASEVRRRPVAFVRVLQFSSVKKNSEATLQKLRFPDPITKAFLAQWPALRPRKRGLAGSSPRPVHPFCPIFPVRA